MAAYGNRNTSHRGGMNTFGGLIIILIEINESKTRKITGYSTAEMTDSCTEFLVNDFADVLKITESITRNPR